MSGGNTSNRSAQNEYWGWTPHGFTSLDRSHVHQRGRLSKERRLASAEELRREREGLPPIDFGRPSISLTTVPPIITRPDMKLKMRWERLITSLKELFQISQPIEERKEFTLISFLKNLFRLIRSHSNYYRIHFTTFVLFALCGSILFWITEGVHRISYIDALFMSTSIVTSTGLSTVNFSRLRNATQILTWFMFFPGGPIITTLPLVLFRQYRYHHFVAQIVKRTKRNFRVYNPVGIWVYVTPSSGQILADDLAVEFRAIGKIIPIVVSYFIFGILIGFISYVIHFYTSSVLDDVPTPYRFWDALFLSVSTFNNVGLTLNSDNFIRFAKDPAVLIPASLLIVMGNTGFPVFLRLYVALLSAIFSRRKRTGPHIRAFKYIMLFPRRCYTHIFSNYQTWILFWLLLILHIIHTLLFLAINWDAGDFVGFSGWEKALASFFQSIATRTPGFNVVNMNTLPDASLILIMGMMYVSTYPVIITLWSSNVTDLWIGEYKSPKDPLSFARTLLLRDFTWIYLAYFIIASSEKDRLEDGDFSPFAVLFEIVSAYGNVGLSLGNPLTSTSLVSLWNPFSKFVLVLVMLLGRHRGLPLSIDRAVQIPPILKASPEEEGGPKPRLEDRAFPETPREAEELQQRKKERDSQRLQNLDVPREASQTTSEPVGTSNVPLNDPQDDPLNSIPYAPLKNPPSDHPEFPGDLSGDSPESSSDDIPDPPLDDPEDDFDPSLSIANLFYDLEEGTLPSEDEITILE